MISRRLVPWKFALSSDMCNLNIVLDSLTPLTFVICLGIGALLYVKYISWVLLHLVKSFLIGAIDLEL